jgi:hypothetical protein
MAHSSNKLAGRSLLAAVTLELNWTAETLCYPVGKMLQ